MRKMCRLEKRCDKGQAAMEYLMIAGFVAAALLPTIYLFYNYAQKSSEKIDFAQLDKIGESLVTAAEKIYYQGPPSRTLIETRMPNGVKDVSIYKDSSKGANVLIFNVSVRGSGVQAFTYNSRVNINGTFTDSLKNLTTFPGVKQINVEAYEQGQLDGSVITFTYINFGGRCPTSVMYNFGTDVGVDIMDALQFGQCYCNKPLFPNHRPSKMWEPGWFDNAAGFIIGTSAVCMNADYNGDCKVDEEDRAQYCTRTGYFCDGPIDCT